MWFRRKPPLPPIPPPVVVAPPPKAEPGIVVEETAELDGEEIAAMTRTGFQRAWDRVTKQFK